MYSKRRGVFRTVQVRPVPVWMSYQTYKKCPLPVLMSYRTYRCVRYQYWCRTELTEVSGSRITPLYLLLILIRTWYVTYLLAGIDRLDTWTMENDTGTEDWRIRSNIDHPDQTQRFPAPRISSANHNYRTSSWVLIPGSPAQTYCPLPAAHCSAASLLRCCAAAATITCDVPTISCSR